MNSISRLQPPTPPPLPSFVKRDASSSNSPAGFSLGLTEANAAPTQSSGAGGLTNVLMDQVRGVNSMQNGADSMVHSLLTGGDVNESEVLTAVQKADLAFRMLLQIRNKLMDAYREVQQIQI